MLNLIALVTIFQVSPLYAAANGVLPRGKSGFSKKGVSGGGGEFTLDCHQYFVHRGQALNYMTDDGSSLFFVSRVADGKSKKTSKDYLLRYDIKSRLVHRKTSFKLQKNTILIPGDKMLSGLIFMSFDRGDGCFSGRGQALGMRVSGANTGTQAGAQRLASGILSRRHYFISSQDGLPVVADPVKGHLLTLDVKSFQKRRGTSFPKGSWPLHNSRKDGLLTLLEVKPESSRLVKVRHKTFEKVSEINLAEYRIIQQKEHFAFAKVDKKSNTIKLRELRGWTGDSDGKYKLGLPTGYSVERAFFELDFKHRRALVYVRSPLRSKRWKKAFVIDYVNNSIIAEIRVPKGHYVDHAVHMKDGEGAIFVLKTFKDHALSAIRYYWYKSNKWEPIHINIQ